MRFLKSCHISPTFSITFVKPFFFRKQEILWKFIIYNFGSSWLIFFYKNLYFIPVKQIVYEREMVLYINLKKYFLHRIYKERYIIKTCGCVYQFIYIYSQFTSHSINGNIITIQFYQMINKFKKSFWNFLFKIEFHKL